MPPENAPPPRLFARRMHPHRSLSQRQFGRLMLFVGAVSVAASLGFYLAGAWPVAGFFGLDIALVYFAFRASFGQRRAYEDVDLTALELRLAKVNPRGQRREWRFNPQWVRLEQERDEEFGVQRLDLISRGHKVPVGIFLGAGQKEDFAREFGHALNQARRGLQYPG